MPSRPILQATRNRSRPISPALSDDLVDGDEPRPLKRATLAGCKREIRFIARQHVQNVWVTWARDIASDHRAELRPLSAIGHREERSQYRLEVASWNRRKVSSGCAFQASHEIIGGGAECGSSKLTLGRLPWRQMVRSVWPCVWPDFLRQARWSRSPLRDRPIHDGTAPNRPSEASSPHIPFVFSKI